MKTSAPALVQVPTKVPVRLGPWVNSVHGPRRWWRQASAERYGIACGVCADYTFAGVWDPCGVEVAIARFECPADHRQAERTLDHFGLAPPGRPGDWRPWADRVLSRFIRERKGKIEVEPSSVDVQVCVECAVAFRLGPDYAEEIRTHPHQDWRDGALSLAFPNLPDEESGFDPGKPSWKLLAKLATGRFASAIK